MSFILSRDDLELRFPCNDTSIKLTNLILQNADLLRILVDKTLVAFCLLHVVHTFSSFSLLQHRLKLMYPQLQLLAIFVLLENDLT